MTEPESDDRENTRPSRPIPQLLLGLIAIAIALVFASGAIRDGLESRNESDTIVVVGSSRRPVEANEASWSVSLSSERSTLESAIAFLDRDFAELEAFVRESDIPHLDIAISPVSLRELSVSDEQGNRTRSGFEVTRTLSVRSDHLDAVVSVASGSDELIASGLPIQTSPLQFVYTKIAGDRAEMTAEAGEDAKERAQAIAAVGGAELGVIRDVQVGNFQVTARGGTNFESGGSFDRSSRLKDIVVVVHLTFELE